MSDAKINDGGPIHPTETHSGISLRDWLAMHYTPSLEMVLHELGYPADAPIDPERWKREGEAVVKSVRERLIELDPAEYFRVVTKLKYAYADEMLTAREVGRAAT